MKNMQEGTVKILRFGAVLFSSLIFCACAFLILSGEIIDSLVAESYIDELLTTAQKISVLTVLCAFISDFLTGNREDRKN